jgi:hypothetical protein
LGGRKVNPNISCVDFFLLNKKGEDFFAFSFTALLYLLIFYFIHSLELRSLTCNRLVEVLQAALLQVTCMTKYQPMVVRL